MAQPRMRTAKPPLTRQNATHHLNAFKLNTTTLEQILEVYPPPEWMGEKARRLWGTAIHSYHPGQFKRYNLPMLEQWVIIIMNINRLTRRMGRTTGLVRPIVKIDEDGEPQTITRVSKEYILYRSLIYMLSRVSADLHMPPRPYVMMSSAESETLDDGYREEGDEQSFTPRNRDRTALIGGRKQAIN